jgi:hypothetical protein
MIDKPNHYIHAYYHDHKPITITTRAHICHQSPAEAAVRVTARRWASSFSFKTTLNEAEERSKCGGGRWKNEHSRGEGGGR